MDKWIRSSFLSPSLHVRNMTHSSGTGTTQAWQHNVQYMYTSARDIKNTHIMSNCVFAFETFNMQTDLCILWLSLL